MKNLRLLTLSFTLLLSQTISVAGKQHVTSGEVSFIQVAISPKTGGASNYKGRVKIDIGTPIKRKRLFDPVS